MRPIVSDLLSRCSFPPAGSDLTCAVSGGADSLALLALASEAGCVVTAVHVDHGLRPGSAGEAGVVAAAARRFGARGLAYLALQSGGEIKSRAGVPATFALFKVKGKKEEPVGDDDKVTVKEGDRFIASPSLDPS